MSSSEFDFEILKEVTGNDPTFEREILEEYLQASERLLERQQVHLENGDARELLRAAHSLRGSSLTMGATRLGELATEIESSAEDHQLTRAASLLEHAVSEFAALRPVLETHSTRLAA